MQHTISVLVSNRFGALARIAGLFSGRGFNIESLNVATTSDTEVSNMTLVTIGDDQKIEQITKQLNKLVDVIEVHDLTKESFIDRELLLIKMNATDKAKEEILRLVSLFRAKVIDVSPNTYTIETTGDENKLTGFIELLRPYGIKEMVRSGKIALSRLPKSID
jgi:acetolactate synthase-1/3 small subunit